MTEMNALIRSLWARTKILLWPESYILVSLPDDSLVEALTVVSSARGHFSTIVVERDEVSLTVEEGLWKSRAGGIPHFSTDGPYRVITLQLNVDLGVSGYFAPAAERLADAGISVVPQCAYLKDHVLIRAADAGRAVEIMENLARECAAAE
jgi:hypothetical protein